MAFLSVDSSPESNNNNNSSRVLQKSIKALEVLLLSAGLFSTLVMLKSALLPYSSHIVFPNLMGLWLSLKCLLSSHLYICIIINFMVLLIAASSTLHRRDTEYEDDDHHRRNTVDFVDHDSLIIELPAPAVATPPQHDSSEDISNISSAAALVFYEALISEAHEIKKALHPLQSKENEGRDETAATNLPDDQENDEEDDTMEATWRSITGKKERPKEKHLKKCETWDMPKRNNIPISKELRKSETFNDAVSITCRGGLRRDPSTSLEEFNRQVEDFIKKFNDNMKLQRQESDQRFLDMVKRGL